MDDAMKLYRLCQDIFTPFDKQSYYSVNVRANITCNTYLSRIYSSIANFCTASVIYHWVVETILVTKSSATAP